MVTMTITDSRGTMTHRLRSMSGDEAFDFAHSFARGASQRRPTLRLDWPSDRTADARDGLRLCTCGTPNRGPLCVACGGAVPVSSGSRTEYGGETYTTWAVFDRSEPFVEELVQDCEPDELAIALTGWCSSYGGAGRPFSHQPVARITKRRVLVLKRGGLDV